MKLQVVAVNGKLSLRRAGFTLLEVLVTLVVVTLGLLGVAALQGRAMSAETEAYQRAQATALLSDMVDRLTANRSVAPCFARSYGTGVATPLSACSGIPGVDGDSMTNADVAMAGWNNLLLGATEQTTGSTPTSVGGIANARGCVVKDASDNLYHIAVAWQGLSETSVPAAPSGASTALTNAVACGSGNYGTSDAARRVIWTSVRIAVLN
jgi:type IV pilus assembly protein PilV